MFGAKLEAQQCTVQVLKGSIIVSEHVQHNLVLTNASELMAANNFEALSAYAALGSSSTAPAVGQATLGAELTRTNLVGGGADTLVRTANGVYEKTVYREFTEAQVGGQNFTEWGFSPTPGANSTLISRELFRNVSNVPITISPAADQRIRLIYTIRITLLPVTSQAGSINIAGVGIRTGTWQLAKFEYAPNGIVNGDLQTFNLVARGQTDNICCTALTNRPSLVYDLVSAPNEIQANTIVLTVGAAYIPNSKSRATSNMIFGSTNANSTITGFFMGIPYNFGAGNVVFGGILFNFNVGQEFTKTNLQKLTLNPFSVSWT